MNVVSYGKNGLPVIILLHAGGLSWWNYQEEANILKEKYHVIVPILDGHANSGNDFISIESNAKRICQYIEQNCNGTVLAISGLSLGAQVLIEMLSQSPAICKYAVVESGLVIPMPLIHKMIRPMFGSCHKLIKKRWFAKLQFANLHIKKNLFELYYKDTCKITKENMIAFLESNSAYRLKESIKDSSAKVLILVGGKEKKKMKMSAQYLHKMLQNSDIIEMPGYYHGNLSINHADEYVKLLEAHLKS